MNMIAQAAPESLGYWLGYLVGATVDGCLFGLLPIIAGSLCRQSRIGYVGFASCVITSIAAGYLFSIVISLLCVAIIVGLRVQAGSGSKSSSFLIAIVI
jgi:hypothetical protein